MSNSPHSAAFSEEELMAYADGLLPAARAMALQAAAQGDASLLSRIEAQAATRRVLQSQFDPLLAAPVPPALLALLQAPALAPPVSRAKRRRAWLPLAMAASLILMLGGLVGRWWWSPPSALSLAMETLPSGSPQVIGKGEWLLLSSLKADQGYCREYQLGDVQGIRRGLACRTADGRWAERVLSRPLAPADSNGYQLAGDGAADAALALSARRLTVAEEQQLLQHHWR